MFNIVYKYSVHNWPTPKVTNMFYFVLFTRAINDLVEDLDRNISQEKIVAYWSGRNFLHYFYRSKYLETYHCSTKNVPF